MQRYNEQRDLPRIDLKTPAILSYDQQNHELQVLNISLQGAGLLSPVELHLQDSGCLEFKVPGYDRAAMLKVQGKVCHQTKVQNKYLIGFEFLHPSAHDNLVINEYFNFHQRHHS